MQIKDKIFTIREQQVMLDTDLAQLYSVKIKRLNEQVKRNIERFPETFMFQLTTAECNYLRSQFATLNKGRGAHRKYIPYVFTEQGVAMLSAVLKSDTAVRVSIQIINAFVSMRKYISHSVQVFHRLDSIEQKHLVYDAKFMQIFDAIESKEIKPQKGIFFDGQVFDAYTFIADIIRSANKSITLVDNYIDDTVLTLLQKRKTGVKVTIFTKEITTQLKLDLDKFNAQNDPIIVKKFHQSHDRFIIIDDVTTYHIGASLKDAGKKWFAFSKFDVQSLELVKRLN